MSKYPYIGLRPFQREETDIFFGREKHTDDLLNYLARQHFLAVIGVSGCGKSSLVKTGLIPSLQAGYLSGAGTHWRIAEMRPGNQPFTNLAQALMVEDALGENYKTELLEDEILKSGSFSLHELLAIKPLPNKEKLLIVCDQFEEIFRYYEQGAKTEAAAFIALLLASAKPYLPPSGELCNDIYVVITMRSDFLDECALFNDLAETINAGLYLTPRLNREQLRLAIEEPALAFDGQVEPELVTKLLEDAGNNQDQLPLLQHLLMRLWNLAADKTAPLTLADYEAVGGLANALSCHADEVFNRLTNEQKQIAEALFRSLTERTDAQRDTRRPMQLAELVELTSASFNEVKAVIDEFRRGGRCFLMPLINVALTAGSVIDISHESLIRQWQRLKDWTIDEAESAKTYQRLEDRAIEWKKSKSSLLQSPELEIYQQWWQEKQPAPLWAKRYGDDFSLAESFLIKSEQEKLDALSRKEQQRLQIERLENRRLEEQLRVERLEKENIEERLKVENLEKKHLQEKELLQKKTNQFLKILIVIIPIAISFLTAYGVSYIKAEKLKQIVAERNKNVIELDLKNKALNKAYEKLEIQNLEKEKQYKANMDAMEICSKKIDKKERIELYTKLNLKKTDFLRNQGDILRKTNKLDEAISSYEKSVDIDNSNNLAWFGLGQAYRVKGEQYNKNNKTKSNDFYQKAIEAYKQVIIIDKNSKWTFYYLGNVYQSQGNFTDAIQYYTKQLSINENSKDQERMKANKVTWYHLGMIYEKQNELDKAISAYENVIKIDQFYPGAEQALEKIKTIRKNKKNSPFVY